MGAIGEFNTTLLNAANTVTGVLSDYAKNKSDFQLSTNSINFNSELQNEITALSRTEGWEKEQFYDESGKAYGLGKSEWEKQIDEWYNTKLSELDNSDSPYFAHNNYERRAMTEMIMQSKASAAAKLEQMAYQKTGEKMVLDAQNSIQKLSEMTQGQEFIDMANEYVKPLKELGYLSPQQYEQWIRDNYTKGYTTYYDNKFSAALDTGIADGKTFDALWNEVLTDKNDMKLYGPDGLELHVDKETLNNTIKKTEQQKYNAKLNQIQSENYDWHDNRIAEGHALITKALTGETVDIQDIYNLVNGGQIKLQTQTGLQLAEGQNKALAKEYEALANAANGLAELGKGGSGSTKKAAAKIDPKTLATALVDQAKRGTLSEKGGRSSIYRAAEVFESRVMLEYQQYKMASANLTPEEASQLTWKDMEEEFPAVNDFFEIAAENMTPSGKSIIANAKVVTKTLLENSKLGEMYDVYWPMIQNLITDYIYEADLSKLDGPALNELNKRTNTAILGVLGSLLKDKNVSIYNEKYSVPTAIDNYKQGIEARQEGKMAAALKELQDNEDYFMLEKGSTKPTFMGSSKTKEGITNLNNDLKKEVASRIKYETGVEVDPAQIQVTNETYNDNKYDVKSTSVFKYGNKTYKFYTEDGKTLQMQELKNGNWQNVMTKKQQAKYDSPESIIKRYINEKDITEMPPIDIQVTLGGGRSMKLTQNLWNNANVNKKQILLDFYNKDPEAAEKYFAKLPEREIKANPIKNYGK